ncbi:hypothetical protein BDN72DRAFT_377344 [Pluteus cervinus]|uniref:Uncharacterized protein n=1 Tax=Pluteus cervinus TaxID=181527 RepID=A0ACD3AAL4_9AGAR|nr:hypothetical protein BDN72DRAFT_377344 [Pluteus cervinus]
MKLPPCLTSFTPTTFPLTSFTMARFVISLGRVSGCHSFDVATYLGPWVRSTILKLGSSRQFTQTRRHNTPAHGVHWHMKRKAFNMTLYERVMLGFALTLARPLSGLIASDLSPG